MLQTISLIQGARGVAATRLGDCDVACFAVCPRVEPPCSDDAIEIISICEVIELTDALTSNNLFVLFALCLVGWHGDVCCLIVREKIIAEGSCVLSWMGVGGDLYILVGIQPFGIGLDKCCVR